MYRTVELFVTDCWTYCAYTGKWSVFCNGWVGDIVIVQESRTFFEELGGDIVIVQDCRTFFVTDGWTYCAYTGKWNVFCNGWVGEIVIVQDCRTFL